MCYWITFIIKRNIIRKLDAEYDNYEEKVDGDDNKNDEDNNLNDQLEEKKTSKK